MDRKFKNNTVKLTKMAMLIAISIALVSLIHFPIFPAAPYLEYDPADVPIIIGTFAFGPVEGIAITIITSIIQGMTVSAASGPYGIIMHIIATGTYVLVAGSIYSLDKTKKNAIKAMALGTLAMVFVMSFANFAMRPVFLGIPVEALIKLLPVFVGFNFIKAGGNSLITYFIYKKISKFLHGDSNYQ